MLYPMIPVSNKVLSHSWNKISNAILYWYRKFTFPSESINCTKVTSRLMSFKMSKASFFFHIVGLYCRFYSHFIFLLFLIIASAKWIIFLDYFVCRVNDYSMLFTMAETALLSSIQWKADSKLLKQQLLDEFWWYCISGASGWNCTFWVIFELPIGTPNVWFFFVLSPLNLAWYRF